MDDIKIFAKNKEYTRNPDTNDKNMFLIYVVFCCYRNDDASGIFYKYNYTKPTFSYGVMVSPVIFCKKKKQLKLKDERKYKSKLIIIMVDDAVSK